MTPYNQTYPPPLPWRYPYLCGHMILRAMLALVNATGRASNARQVKDDEPDENGYPGPTGWGLGVRLTTSPHKNLLWNLKKKEEAKGYYYYHHHHHRHRISHFSALAGKYSPILGCSNQQD